MMWSLIVLIGLVSSTGYGADWYLDIKDLQRGQTKHLTLVRDQVYPLTRDVKCHVISPATPHNKGFKVKHLLCTKSGVTSGVVLSCPDRDGEIVEFVEYYIYTADNDPEFRMMMSCRQGVD